MKPPSSSGFSRRETGAEGFARAAEVETDADVGREDRETDQHPIELPVAEKVAIRRFGVPLADPNPEEGDGKQVNDDDSEIDELIGGHGREGSEGLA